MQGFDVTRKFFHGCFKVFELNCFYMPEVTNFYLLFSLFFYVEENTCGRPFTIALFCKREGWVVGVFGGGMGWRNEEEETHG